MKWQEAIVTCCRLTEKSLIEKIFSLIRFFKKRPGLDSSLDQRIKRLKKEASLSKNLIGLVCIILNYSDLGVRLSMVYLSYYCSLWSGFWLFIQIVLKILCQAIFIAPQSSSHHQCSKRSSFFDRIVSQKIIDKLINLP